MSFSPPPVNADIGKDTPLGAGWLRWINELWATVIVAQGVVEYYAPGATGFTHTIADNTTLLVMQPGGAYATGTLTLPASPADGNRVAISTTQAVTAITISASHTINNAPTTLAAGQGFALVYLAANTAWYRVY